MRETPKPPRLFKRNNQNKREMAKDCTESKLYESLRHCAGSPVLPGIRQRGYFASKSDIVAWPKLAGKAAKEMREISVYQGSFTLAADKKWRYIDFTQNKGTLSYETQGDEPSRTFLNKATLNHPEIDEDAAAASRQMLYDDVVFVIPQRDGKWRVLGNESFPTDTKPQGTTGEGMTGEVGTTLEIEVADVCPLPFYVGTLDTEDGEIDCSGKEAPAEGGGTENP